MPSNIINTIQWKHKEHHSVTSKCIHFSRDVSRINHRINKYLRMVYGYEEESSVQLFKCLYQFCSFVSVWLVWRFGTFFVIIDRALAGFHIGWIQAWMVNLLVQWFGTINAKKCNYFACSSTFHSTSSQFKSNFLIIEFETFLDLLLSSSMDTKPNPNSKLCKIQLYEAS